MTLTPQLLIRAYCNGAFPMPDEKGRIHWYRPDPRAILELDALHVSRTLRRLIKKEVFKITYDTCFEDIMRACGNREEGNWINEEMITAYCDLHKLGMAHSVEVWQDGALAGGCYGVHLGGAFFGESMFHRVTDASKVALVKLVERLNERKFVLLETQYVTDHLATFGVKEIPDAEYMKRLDAALRLKRSFM